MARYYKLKDRYCSKSVERCILDLPGNCTWKFVERMEHLVMYTSSESHNLVRIFVEQDFSDLLDNNSRKLLERDGNLVIYTSSELNNLMHLYLYNRVCCFRQAYCCHNYLLFVVDLQVVLENRTNR